MASNRLDAWVDPAREWAGPGLLALILGGSHARGDAVWGEADGRELSLSDLDLYAVVPDRRTQRAARRRAAAGRSGLAARLRERGLAGTLEVSFLTPEELASLPARPGTIELKRHGRVLEGEAAWLERVPDWTACDVSAEEILLLLENRAFELLDARTALQRPDRLARLAARHATLKVALDLAAAECLAAGEYPDGAATRVAAVRARPRYGAEPPWDAALAWREGHVTALDPAAADAEWLATATAWVATWRERVAATAGGLPAPREAADPYAATRRVARRARLRRRLRQALGGAPGTAGTPLAARLRFAARGTPQHRLGAAAAVMLIRATAGPDAAAGWRAALAWLGVVGATAEAHEVERALLHRWDRGVRDGQRGVEAS